MSLLTRTLEKIRLIFPGKDIAFTSNKITVTCDLITDETLNEISEMDGMFKSMQITAMNNKLLLTFNY